MNPLCKLGRYAASAILLTFLATTEPALAERITYIHSDALGSPIAATTSTGTVAWQEYYYPFGDRERLQGEGNAIWYTGKAQDEDTLLVYMGGRYYNPLIGRFLSTDPIHFTDDNPFTFNRYSYANNNPYRYRDPDGEAAETIVDLGYLIFDAGRFIGASAATAVGAVTSNAALTQAGLEGMSETGVDFGGSLAGIAIPGAPALTTRSAARSVAKVAEGTAGGTRAGKSFTRKGKAEIDTANAQRNGGANVCQNCGTEVVPGLRSQRGVTPPGNERQRDHIIPRSRGGDGDPSNGQILCRDCNLDMGDKL